MISHSVITIDNSETAVVNFEITISDSKSKYCFLRKLRKLIFQLSVLISEIAEINFETAKINCEIAALNPKIYF